MKIGALLEFSTVMSTIVPTTDLENELVSQKAQCSHTHGITKASITSKFCLIYLTSHPTSLLCR